LELFFVIDIQIYGEQAFNKKMF